MARSRDETGKFKCRVTEDKLLATVRKCCERAGGDVPASDVARKLKLVSSSVSQMLRGAYKKNLVSRRTVQDGNLVLWKVVDDDET